MSNPNPLNSKNLKFKLIVELLLKGKQPSEICQQFNWSEARLDYYLKPLKIEGIIKRIGYGTWEVNKEELKKVKPENLKKSNPYATPKPPLKKLLQTPNAIRGHGFTITLRTPKIPNWHKRQELLSKKQIQHTKIQQGQRIEVYGNKVWLCNKSLVVFLNNSYFAYTAKDSRKYAIYDFLRHIKYIENILGLSLRINKQYKLRLSKRHYSLLKNELAKQYNKEGRKLYIRDSGDLWLIVDDSYNLSEMECISTKRAEPDTDKVTVPFFNDLRKHEGYTPSFVLQSFGETNKIIQSYTQQLTKSMELHEYNDRNIKKHFKVLKGIERGIGKMVRVVSRKPKDKIDSKQAGLGEWA